MIYIFDIYMFAYGLANRRCTILHWLLLGKFEPGQVLVRGLSGNAEAFFWNRPRGSVLQRLSLDCTKLERALRSGWSRAAAHSAPGSPQPARSASRGTEASQTWYEQVCSFSNPSDEPSRGHALEAARRLGMKHEPMLVTEESLTSWIISMNNDPYDLAHLDRGK